MTQPACHPDTGRKTPAPGAPENGSGSSAFDPYAPAPDSALKQLISRVNRSPLEDAIQNAMDAEDGCFRRDFMTADEVVETLMGRGLDCRRPRPSSVGIIFGRMGLKQLPQQRVAGYGKPRFWVWRNIERWSRAEPNEIADHYLASLAPANDNLSAAHAA